MDEIKRNKMIRVIRKECANYKQMVPEYWSTDGYDVKCEMIKDFCIYHDDRCPQILALNNTKVDYAEFVKNNPCAWLYDCVLPNHQELLDTMKRSKKRCKYCGNYFEPNHNREEYCCEAHREMSRKKQLREAQRKFRSKGQYVINKAS